MAQHAGRAGLCSTVRQNPRQPLLARPRASQYGCLINPRVAAAQQFTYEIERFLPMRGLQVLQGMRAV